MKKKNNTKKESVSHNKQQEKVKTVMKEFKEGTLHSSSGDKVTNPKQAIAIAMSESGQSKKKKKK